MRSGHDRPESAVTMTGIRSHVLFLSLAYVFRLRIDRRLLMIPSVENFPLGDEAGRLSLVPYAARSLLGQVRESSTP